MFELSDPKTYWLNLTNIGLGIVTLACLVILCRSVLLDIWDRIKGRAPAAVHLDDHTFFEPELGLTMADGGEKRANGERQSVNQRD